MDEDNEVLDWGHDDDEQQYDARPENGTAEDVEEDAVSLGGDDDEPYYAYQSTQQEQPEHRQAVPSKPPSTQSHQQHAALPPPLSQGSNRDLQRENSGSSLKPTQTGHPQYSPHRSPKRRSQSFGKLTHSLPPKPVLSAVPYLQTTHPSSIIEATAMSVHRDKKNGQPISAADTVDALPPDWEAKQPRTGGGVYYYNIRTNESTWSRPGGGARSPTKDKERSRALTGESRPRSANNSPVRRSEPIKQPYHSGRSEEPPVSQSSLSYGDRHYRPGDAPAPVVAEKRREERYDTSLKRSVTPPRMSPEYLPRPPSPIGRGRDETRGHRTARKASPMAAVGDYSSSLRDTQRERHPPRGHSPSRTWAPPPESLARNPSGRRPVSSHDHHRQRSEDADMPPAPHTYKEDRKNSAQKDADWSSAPRHRSPPPHVRQPRPSASRDAHINDVSEPLPQRRSTSTTRPNSRFDQPASAFLKSSTRTEPYMTGADRLIGRDRNDRRESDTSRDYNSQSHMSSNYDVRQSLLDDDSPPASVLGPSRSPSPSSGGLMTDQSRTKRTPLPPQAARFMQVVSTRKPDGPPALSVPPPPRANEGGIAPRNSNFDNNLPSGPRRQPQAGRDISDTFDSRQPPSGPLTGRPRRDDLPFPSVDSMSRGIHMMDVDPPAPHPPKPAPIRTADTPIRANSGMYADREQHRMDQGNAADAPRGPKAMINNNRVSSHSVQPPFAGSPTTTPTTPYYPQRPVGSNVKFDRSPPSHTISGQGYQVHEPVYPPPGGRRGMPTERGQNGSRPGTRGPGNGFDAADLREHAPTRDNQPPPHATQPQLAFSGSNSVPIGNRKGPPSGPGPQTGINPRSRGRFGPPITTQVDPSHSLQEFPTSSISQHSYGDIAKSPLVVPRRPTDMPPRRQSFGDPARPPLIRRPISPVDSFNSSAPSGRPHGDNWLSNTEPSHRPRDMTPRTWAPRQAEASYGQIDPMRVDDAYRAPTPTSHHNSSSTPWATDRHRQSGQYQADKHQTTAPYNEHSRYEEAGMGEPRPRRGELEDVNRQQDRRVPSGQYERRGMSPTLDSRIGAPPPPRRFPEESIGSHRNTSVSPTTLRRDTFNDREIYPEATRRTNYTDDHDRAPQAWRREQQSKEDQPSPPPVVPVHLDRARAFEQDTNPDLPRHSKPVRIRRPPPSPPRVSSQSEAYSMPSEAMVDRWAPDGSGRDEEQAREAINSGPRSHVNNHHPRSTPSRRGASLLDRLSTDMPSASLVDRVHIPSKRHRDEIAGDDTPGDYEYEDGPADPSQRRGAVPRRMKVRRGRRGGGP